MKKSKKEQQKRVINQKTPAAGQRNNNTHKPNIYGLHAVREAWLNKNRAIHALYITPAAQRQFENDILKAKKLGLQRPEPVILEKAKFEKMMQRDSVHQGIALNCDPLEEMDVQDLVIRTHDNRHSVIALLDQVTDPHNVGAIMRSASAFGLDGLVMQTRHAPALEGVLAKTACGAVDHIPVACATNLSRALEDLKEAGYTALGMDERGSTEIGELLDLGSKIVVVLGSEGTGIRPLVKEKCDVLTRLPTGGAIASLNVSNAAAVAFYALRSVG